MQLFIGMHDTNIARHFKAARVMRYAEGEVICSSDMMPDRLFILVSGLARCSLLGPNGCERLLYYRRHGCLLGDTAFFGQGNLPQGLHVVAVEPCEVIQVTYPQFRSVLAEQPQLALALLAQAHAKVASLLEQLEYATFTDTFSQIAALILALVSEASATSPPPGNRLLLNMTHQTMAAATGRTRVTVTYALNRLQDLGVIRLHKGKIEVLDIKALERCANQAYRPLDRQVHPDGHPLTSAR